jgi:hypothetical protein
MATSRQKEAARQNIAKAREIQSERAHGIKIPRQTRGLSTADQDKLPDKDFAFPKERKEPLIDARHVRNAIARFDQVEDVTDAERDRAWKRIITAAKRFDVEVAESNWRDLYKGNKKAAKASAAKPPAAKTAKAPAAKAPAAKTAKAPAAKAPAAKKAKAPAAKTAKASAAKTSRAAGAKTGKTGKTARASKS